MRNKSKFVLAALAASALLALAVGGASANRLSTSERNFELIWNNSITGKQRLSFRDNGGHNVECNVTLLGRYTGGTIVKRTGIDQGTINHGELESCTGGSATIRTETMPWRLQYLGFTGTLPRIETIRTALLGASFRVEASGIPCNSITEANHPGVGIIEGTGLENIRADETQTIPLERGICSLVSPGRFGGRGLIRNLPNTANITITLI